MYETQQDLHTLQDLLDRSFQRQGEHMRSIITEQRRLTAEELVARLTGMRLLSLATVTKDGRPRNAPVDGFFYRGAFWFGSSPHSLRIRHIRQRPDVSATHLEGEALGIIVHGRAEIIDHGTEVFQGFARLATETYGEWWPKQMIAWREEYGEPAPYARINPERMHVFAMPKQPAPSIPPTVE
ncbi:MAG: pyridoxamine 5'-phosphate oxidase family protein [Thermomicrobiales bacterium]